MITPNRPTVFISYARKDGREFAHSLREKLEAVDEFTIWQDVVSETTGEDWWLNIIKAIEAADTMILIITEGALNSNVVNDEWIYARKTGTAIVPVVLDDAIFKTNKLPRWLNRLDLLILDEKHPDYAPMWERFLRTLHSPNKRVIPFNVPSLPDEWVSRSAVESAILEALIEDGFSPKTARIALIGEGGFGKSTIAQTICYQPEIIEAFKDGIIWIELGENATQATVLTKINAVLKLLHKGEETVLDNARNKLHDALVERDCLLVIDDVWQPHFLEYFLVPAEDPDREYKGRRAWIFTSRYPDISRYIEHKDHIHHIQEMTPAEATDLLQNFIPEHHTVTEAERTQLTDIAQQLGYWPLLLKLDG